jgi:outer membrane protein TolC
MKIFTFLICFWCLAFASFGQSGNITPAYAQRKFFDSSDVVLPVLINVAINASHEVKKATYARAVAENDLKQSKNEILKSFYFNGNYNYGSGSNSILNVQQNQFNAFAKSGSALYLVGFNMNITFEQIFGGISKRVNKQKLVVDEASEDAKIQETAVRVKIITLYKTLLLSKILYDHAEDALQTANVNKSLVDKQLRAGEVKLTDQMAANDLYARTLADREQAKSNYQLNVMLLEEAIGMPLNQFIKDNVK